MSKAIDQYIDRVMIYANPKPVDEPDLRAELRDHLETKVEQLKAEGAAAEDAVFAAIEDHGPAWRVGYGLRPKWPWIDIRAKGTARGVIAIGPKAVGMFAFGGAAMGVFAFGTAALGVVSMGLVGVGLLFAFCFLGLAPVSYSGIAIGLLAVGSFGMGVVTWAQFGIGIWAGVGFGGGLWPVDTAPTAVRWIAETFLNWRVWTITCVSVLIAFMALWSLYGIAARREHLRVAKADSHLAE